VCIVADGFGTAPVEWHEEAALAMVRRLATYLGPAPIVFAGASHVMLIATAARELRLARERLIGSAPEALVSALAAIVALEARCSPREVSVTAIGSPPDGLVVPWSEATIGGYLIDSVLSQVQRARIQARAAHLWPPGPYALGAAAALVTEGVLHGSRRSFSVITPLDGELGVRDGAAALPAVLDSGGIARIRVPLLSPRERVQLETALGA
jgi:malate/lactate dehydrogenase